MENKKRKIQAKVEGWRADESYGILGYVNVEEMGLVDEVTGESLEYCGFYRVISVIVDTGREIQVDDLLSDGLIRDFFPRFQVLSFD